MAEMKTLQWCLAPPKQRFMSRTRNHSVVGMGVGDVLLFKIETEEYIFEQWSMHEQTTSKKQHQAKVR